METIKELQELMEQERCKGNRNKFLEIQKQIEVNKHEEVLSRHMRYFESVKKEFLEGTYISELNIRVKELKQGCGTQRGWIEIYLSGSEKSISPHDLRRKIQKVKEEKEAQAEFNKIKFSDKKLLLCIGKKNLDILDMLIRVMDLDLPTFEEVDDCNVDWYSEVYGNAKDSAVKDGYTDEEAEQQAGEVESEEREKIFKDYYNAIEQTLNYLLEFHNLGLVEKNKCYFVEAKESWEKVAQTVIETINGMGPFYYENIKAFKDIGPYKSYCEASMQHLHWLRHYTEVYGGTNYRRIYERR